MSDADQEFAVRIIMTMSAFSIFGIFFLAWAYKDHWKDGGE